jgi:hypothetical protein
LVEPFSRKNGMLPQNSSPPPISTETPEGESFCVNNKENIQQTYCNTKLSRHASKISQFFTQFFYKKEASASPLASFFCMVIYFGGL